MICHGRLESRAGNPGRWESRAGYRGGSESK